MLLGHRVHKVIYTTTSNVLHRSTLVTDHVVVVLSPSKEIPGCPAINHQSADDTVFLEGSTFHHAFSGLGFRGGGSSRAGRGGGPVGGGHGGGGGAQWLQDFVRKRAARGDHQAPLN